MRIQSSPLARRTFQNKENKRCVCDVKISTGHTRTHTPTENNTPDTDTEQEYEVYYRRIQQFDRIQYNT